MPDPKDLDIINRRFTTSSGKDVRDTMMLKGEAKDSLYGSNSTVQDSRTSPSPGKTGGEPTVK
jgi:hypothetical protein